MSVATTRPSTKNSTCEIAPPEPAVVDADSATEAPTTAVVGAVTVTAGKAVAAVTKTSDESTTLFVLSIL